MLGPDLPQHREILFGEFFLSRFDAGHIVEGGIANLRLMRHIFTPGIQARHRVLVGMNRAIGTDDAGHLRAMIHLGNNTFPVRINILQPKHVCHIIEVWIEGVRDCLLYTSDAADE